MIFLETVYLLSDIVDLFIKMSVIYLQCTVSQLFLYEQNTSTCLKSLYKLLISTVIIIIYVEDF